jgi:hypothetical protein
LMPEPIPSMRPSTRRLRRHPYHRSVHLQGARATQCSPSPGTEDLWV